MIVRKLSDNHENQLKPDLKIEFTIKFVTRILTVYVWTS